MITMKRVLVASDFSEWHRKARAAAIRGDFPSEQAPNPGVIPQRAVKFPAGVPVTHLPPGHFRFARLCAASAFLSIARRRAR